ncbi:MAG: hypothetical protein L0H96_06525 [Humibacillus sp.]|nr:hypothetical protein [Humibacillus sp.]MDN5776548.1 hypothetical protein [Humibacillus sp.]
MPADRATSDAGPTEGADARRPGGGQGVTGSPAEWLEQAASAQPADFTTPGAPHACTQRTHSRLADGRLLCWRPSGSTGLHLAIDAEITGQPVPRALARRAATDDPLEFWPLWTRAEVRAKLHGIPIIHWLGLVDWSADGDLDAPLDIVTVVGASVVLSYGVREPRGAAIT